MFQADAIQVVVSNGEELLSAILNPEAAFIIVKNNVTINSRFWPVDGATVNRTLNLLGDTDSCTNSMCTIDAEGHALHPIRHFNVLNYARFVALNIRFKGGYIDIGQVGVQE